MSTYVPYDPTLFAVERASAMSGLLGAFNLNESRLGQAETEWVPLSVASFTMSGGYVQDENKVLILDATSATLSLSFWTDPGYPLLPADRVRATYDGHVLFEGIVDTVKLTTEVDGDAAAHGAVRRYDFTANATDAWWVAMNRPVVWESLDKEMSIVRVRRFVTVTGWE